ncbi:hypothetical protein H072_9096 [Dactylellina haptotyla CBS 200.50]|uniref:F-box domain-containing protein n=1 Tax=Dactylellina haptotyla (strain CBS 200.50) TaxID=1284197 RepID=S8A889_DACHA|nr:hypothetical protein H072_9096 [Dactylellina haptotyla CBS 200.50]
MGRNLLTLPSEIHGLIAKELDPPSLASLTRCCRSLMLSFTHHLYHTLDMTVEVKSIEDIIEHGDSPIIRPSSLLSNRDFTLKNVSCLRVSGNLGVGDPTYHTLLNGIIDKQIDICLLRKVSRGNLRIFEWDLGLERTPFFTLYALSNHENLTALRITLRTKLREQRSSQIANLAFKNLQKLYITGITNYQCLFITQTLVNSARSLKAIRLEFSLTYKDMLLAGSHHYLSKLRSGCKQEEKYYNTPDLGDTVIVDTIYKIITDKHSPESIHLYSAPFFKQMESIFPTDSLRSLTIRNCESVDFSMPSTARFRLENLHLQLNHHLSRAPLLNSFIKRLKPGLVTFTLLTWVDEFLPDADLPTDLEIPSHHRDTLQNLALCTMKSDSEMEPIWSLRFTKEFSLNEFFFPCDMDFENPEWVFNENFDLNSTIGQLPNIQILYLAPKTADSRAELQPPAHEASNLGGLCEILHQILAIFVKFGDHQPPRLECIVFGLQHDDEGSEAFHITWMKNNLRNCGQKYLPSVYHTSVEELILNTNLPFKLYPTSFGIYANSDKVPAFR